VLPGKTALKGASNRRIFTQLFFRGSWRWRTSLASSSRLGRWIGIRRLFGGRRRCDLKHFTPAPYTFDKDAFLLLLAHVCSLLFLWRRTRRSRLWLCLRRGRCKLQQVSAFLQVGAVFWFLAHSLLTSDLFSELPGPSAALAQISGFPCRV
jgi:hypothetical protein